MSDDRLPAVRPDQQIVRKEENEEEIIEVEGREIPQPPAPSIAGQIVKAVVYSALEWFDKRRTSNQSLINRSVGAVSPTQPRIRRQSSMGMGGKRRNRQTSEEDESRFGSAGRRGIQSCGSGNRRVRRRKKRMG